MTNTIKVPVEPRDRIAGKAQERGATAADLIENLLAGWLRTSWRCRDEDLWALWA